MRRAEELMAAVSREFKHIRRRGGTDVDVSAEHNKRGELVAVVTNSLGGIVPVQKFICWEKHGDKSPTKRVVWSRPDTTIVASEVA